MLLLLLEVEEEDEHEDDDSTSSSSDLLNSGRSSMSDDLTMPPSINLRFKRAPGSVWEIILATMGRREVVFEVDGVNVNAYPNTCKRR